MVVSRNVGEHKENVRLRSSFKHKEPERGGALNKSTFHHWMTGALLSRSPDLKNNI